MNPDLPGYTLALLLTGIALMLGLAVTCLALSEMFKKDKQ